MGQRKQRNFGSMAKALNGNSLIFAHPSTLNNGKPIGYRDASLDFCDEATPHTTSSFISKFSECGVHTTFGLSVI